MNATLTTHRELRRIALSDFAEVQAKAQADHHATIAPTHVMTKNGQIIGAASIGAIVLVLPWFSTAECKPKDSVFFIREMESTIARTIPPQFPGLICVPFVPHSAFMPYREKLGYQTTGLVDLTFKKLR